MNERDIARFWAKVDRCGPDECWPWTASVQRKGYGKFGRNGQWALAHRVAFLIHNGREAQEHCLHRCDNPACCNPAHLFEGSNQDNVDDKLAKGRHPRGEFAPWAKLDVEKVAAILALRGTLSPRKIAGLFGVSQASVRQVLEGKRWRHVTGL